MAIDLLKTTTGLDGLLPPVSSNQLQEVTDISINSDIISSQESIEALFAKSNMMSNILSSLSVEIQDSSVYQFQGFNQKLEQVYADLQNTREPKLRAFVKEVLEPLKADQEVLQNYLLNGLKV